MIARPSIIVGDSRSGWTSAFNVIYWPMRAFSRGLMDEVAIDPDGVADIVPIDYVAEALLALLDHEDVRGTVALVAAAGAPTNAELIDLAARQFGREPPRIVATPSRLADASCTHPTLGSARVSTTPTRVRCSVRSGSPSGVSRLLRDADRLRRAGALGQGPDHAPSGGDEHLKGSAEP